MEIKVNLSENQSAELVISCSGEEWKKAQNKEFNKRRANLEVKGFRKGNVPADMANRYINRAEVINDALIELVNKAYGEAVEEHKLQVFSEPKLDVKKVSEEEFEVTVSFALPPKVTLGEYKGIKATKGEVKVTDKEIEAHIDSLRNQHATMNVKEGEAAVNDTVIIDFKGYVDDVAFDGGEAKGYELKLGSNSFVPGFEDQLVGIKANEDRVVNIKFPENYVADLKGKDARFEVHCSDVKETVLPEINEEFFEELHIEGVNSVETLNDHARKTLVERKTREVENEYLNTIINKIIDNATVAVGDTLIEAEANAQIDSMKKQVESNGLKFDDFLSINNQTMEQLVEMKKEEAARNIKAMLVIEEICRAENIFVTKEVLDAKFEEIAKQYNMSKEDVEKALGNNIEQFARNLRNSLFNEFILKNNA